MRSTAQLAGDVGQLLWVGFEETRVPDELARAIAGQEVGMVVLFARNLPRAADADADAPLNARAIDVAALVDSNAALHALAPGDGPPLWIAVDQEGGRVQRVRAPAPPWPPMLELTRASVAQLGPDGAEQRVEEVGLAMGRELQALGFDVDFAPVLDVHTNADNPIIGDRAFATQAEEAARYALAFARGLDAAGIIGCGKHFPGHGDTDTDSHLTLPRLGHDMDRLGAVELLPFAHAARANLPMLMTAHVVFSALDERVPATLSERVITGLLRQELGYGGIVVSDDLDMRAITTHFGVGDAAVRAIEAGCDALLLCRSAANQRAAREALIRAGERDSRIRERIGASAARIRQAKQEHARRALPRSDASAALALFERHRALARLD